MMDPTLTDRLKESQLDYSHESAIQSVTGSLDNSDDEESIQTKQPMQPESVLQTGTVYQLHNSFPSRPQSFPYQPTTIIDDRLRELALKYEIQVDLAERLRALQDYEIILVCDDSGSMKTTVDNEVETIFDSTGIDIYFLNRRPIYNVTDPNSVDEAFSDPPRGYTPLVTALKYIFQLPVTRRGNDKKVLVFIATDGAPTDDKGNINVDDLEHLMIYERQVETTYVMFLICTDDSTCVDYLAEWDKKMIHVDITDDFKTERDKIRQYQGQHYPFSKGDYIVKALIGAIDSQIDILNEPIKK